MNWLAGRCLPLFVCLSVCLFGCCCLHIRGVRLCVAQGKCAAWQESQVGEPSLLPAAFLLLAHHKLAPVCCTLHLVVLSTVRRLPPTALLSHPSPPCLQTAGCADSEATC